VRSDIFRNPNPLQFNITLPPKDAPKVPPGIRCPKTFLEVGKYLHYLLITEIGHGGDPYLATWKNRPTMFNKAYQAQFTAYAQGTYPFAVPLGPNQSPVDWWRAFENSDQGGILAVCAPFPCLKPGGC